jgi:hypothetical protein
MKNRIALVFLLFVSAQYAFSQNSGISGKVLDSRTLEPLPFANVYLNNTTIGATTNPAGEFLIKNVPVGLSELVFSYVGYQTYQVKIDVTEKQLAMGVIKLIQAEAQLSEVEVKVKRDNIWEKQLKRFEKIFLGDGQLANNCKIVNPWVVDFTDDGKTFMAKAILPLEIENRNLGYKLFFQLKDFKSSADRYSIVGNTRFEEIPTMDARVALNWMKNREQVYLGSVRHLMKSILGKKITSEGFRLFAEKASGKFRSNNFAHELEHNLIPYDTSDIVKLFNIGEQRIFLKDRIEVHYLSELNKTPYYKDISHAVSWIEVKNGNVRVNSDGTLLNAADVIISGDMSNGRVATLLPLDYQRGRIIKIQSRQTLVAKRLQEKVYLHTDKPYYYPGENIWFSGYMNYRIPAVKDTLSKVLHVQLHDKNGALVKSLTLEIDSGRVNGNIRLPEKMAEGSYMITAYTQWMRNYGDDYIFHQPVSILNLLDKVQATKEDTSVNVSDGLAITFNKPTFKKRERVRVIITAQDKNDSIKATLSISVTDAQQVAVIPTHSILDDYPFEEEMPAGMLPVFQFRIERGISVKGIYRNKKGKPEKKDLTIVQDGFANIFQVKSDDKGNFAINDLAFYDSVRFAIQSGTGTVALRKEESPVLSEKYFGPDVPTVRMSTPQRIFSTYDVSDAILLKEVEVVGKRIDNEPKYENPYGKPDLYLKGESISSFASVADAIVAKMPGYKLVSYEGQRFLIWSRGEFTRVRAPSEPVVYINGSQLTGNGTAGERLFELNPALIDHIEVSSMISTNLGATGANGLIAVFTKRAEDPKFKGLPLFKVKGFDTQSEFRSPDYENTFTDSTLTDYRSTLYWNPWVDLNENGQAEISFFASDLEGEYRVVVEGITSRGKPVRAVAYVRVDN